MKMIAARGKKQCDGWERNSWASAGDADPRPGLNAGNFKQHMIRIERLIKSFVYALRGLSKTYREEQNLRVQTAVGTVMVALALIFRINRLEWCLLLLTIGLVILMEIANSAVERITDVLKPRINGYVKEIKDIAAAAVMLSSLISVIIGVIIFWPYLFDAWRNLDI